VGRGKTVFEAVKKIGVPEQTYYRWKKRFGGLRIDQAKRLKDLEKENSRLKRPLAHAELDSGVSRAHIGTPLGGAAQLLSLVTAAACSAASGAATRASVRVTGFPVMGRVRLISKRDRRHSKDRTANNTSACV